MSIEENKAVVMQLIERNNKGDTTGIDELTTNSFVLHWMDGIDMDRESFKQFISQTRITFPDYTSTINDMVAEGDKVTVRATGRGTQTGELHNIAPTGKSVTTVLFMSYRIEGGKIAEMWTVNDRFGTFQQLGVIPPTEELGK